MENGTDIRSQYDEEFFQMRANMLENMKAHGTNPYPHTFHVDMTMHAFMEKYGKLNADSNVKGLVAIAGRICGKFENNSKEIFYELTSQGFKIQIATRRSDYEDEQNFNVIISQIKFGDIVGVNGHVTRSKDGNLSISATKITILAPCMKNLCNPSDQMKHDVEFKKRHLDLILKPELLSRFCLRTKVIKYIKSFLEDRQFEEVETPILNLIPGGAMARPFVCHHDDLNKSFYLRIAPELFLKQLIIGGYERIYEIGKQFRNEEIDLSHNPEFTTCEFYMAYADYNDLMTITEELLSSLVHTLFGTYKIMYSMNGTKQEVDFTPPFRKIDMMTELERHLETKLPNPNDLHSEESRQLMEKICMEKGINCSEPRTTARMLDKLVGQYIECSCISPTFIIHHPEVMSPLARYHRDIPGLTERFELFVLTKEICNAYTNLNDPVVQRKRFQQQAKDKEAGDEEAMFTDEAFLDALCYGYPPTGGWGLGIDRLCMFLSNTNNIKDVVLFPMLKPDEN